MQFLLLRVIAATCLCGLATAAPTTNDITPSIVKIYTTYQKASWSRRSRMNSISRF